MSLQMLGKHNDATPPGGYPPYVVATASQATYDFVPGPRIPLTTIDASYEGSPSPLLPNWNITPELISSRVNDATLDGFDTGGRRITITHHRCRVRDFRVTYTYPLGPALNGFTLSTSNPLQDTLIEWGEIDGGCLEIPLDATGRMQVGIGEHGTATISGTTIRGVKFHHTRDDNIKIRSANALIELCELQSGGMVNGAHYDPIDCSNACGPVTIRNNRLLMRLLENSYGPTSCIAVFGAGNHLVIVEKNHLGIEGQTPSSTAGALNYCMYASGCENNTDTIQVSTNIIVRNNAMKASNPIMMYPSVRRGLVVAECVNNVDFDGNPVDSSGWGDTDNVPNSFSLGSNVTGATPGAEYTSALVTVSGLGPTSGAKVFITSTAPGHRSINGGAYVVPNPANARAELINGNTVRMKLIASMTPGATVTTQLNMGGVISTWSVTTAP